MYRKKIRTITPEIDNCDVQSVVNVLNTHKVVTEVGWKYEVDNDYVVLVSPARHLANRDFECQLALIYGVVLALVYTDINFTLTPR